MQRHLQLRIEAQGKYLEAVLEKAQETIGSQNSGTTFPEASSIHLPDFVSKASTECLNSVVDQELYNNLSLKPSSFGSRTEMKVNDNESSLRKMELRWHKDNVDLSSLSMSIGKEKRYNEAEAGAKFFEQSKTEKQKESPESKLSFFSTKLDLNADDDNDVASSCRQFDLNGFSWSWEEKGFGINPKNMLLWWIIIQVTEHVDCNRTIIYTQFSETVFLLNVSWQSREPYLLLLVHEN